jgi:hypothetical protein
MNFYGNTIYDLGLWTLCKANKEVLSYFDNLLDFRNIIHNMTIMTKSTFS